MTNSTHLGQEEENLCNVHSFAILDASQHSNFSWDDSDSLEEDEHLASNDWVLHQRLRCDRGQCLDVSI